MESSDGRNRLRLFHKIFLLKFGALLVQLLTAFSKRMQLLLSRMIDNIVSGKPSHLPINVDIDYVAYQRANGIFRMRSSTEPSSSSEEEVLSIDCRDGFEYVEGYLQSSRED